MTKKTRRKIFWIVVAIFILTTPAILAYARGYRLNLNNLQIQKTGGFYLRSVPQRATILINGEKSNTTTSFISGINAGEYTVEIKKKGRSPWKKNMEVLPGFVTEAASVYLPPLEMKTETILKGTIKQIVKSQDKNLSAIIIRENHREKIVIWNNKEKTALPEGALNSYDGLSIKNIRWSQDKNWLLFQETSPQKRWIVYSFKDKAIKFLDNISKNKFQIAKVKFHPRDENRIFILTVQKELLSVELKEELVIGPLAKNISSFFVLPDQILATSPKDHQLKSLHFDGSKKEVVLKNFNQEIKKAVFQSDVLFILDKALTLHLITERAALPEKINGILDFKTDKKTVLLKSDTGTAVLFLGKDSAQPRRKSGDIEFIREIVSRKVIWLGPNKKHIAALDNNKLVIAEIDGRNTRNVYTPKINLQRARQLIPAGEDKLWIVDIEGLKEIQLDF